MMMIKIIVNSDRKTYREILTELGSSNIAINCFFSLS